MRIRKTITGMAMIAVLTGGMSIPALAQTSLHQTAVGQTTVARERLEFLCARIPLVKARIDKVTAWIHGDASTRGSIAWLQQKAAAAESRGFDDLATRLRLRIDVLNELDDLMQARLARLAVLEDKCVELGAL